MKIWKVIRNGVLGLAVLVVLLLVAFQIVMRPSVLTGLVNKFAADYVEGSLNFDEVRAHAIKSFPYLHVEASNFSITYPHERYARFDSLYPYPRRRFNLIKAGNGIPDQVENEGATDTLASFKALDLWLNYMALIKGDIHVHKVALSRPRIFAHYFDSTAANWDILPIGKDTAEKEKKPLPTIKVNQVRLLDRPFIVFTDPVDTLHGLFTLRQLSLDGKINTDALKQARVTLEMDSLFVSGRLPSDTLSLRMKHLRARAGKRRLELSAEASARLRTGAFGRLEVPIGVELDSHFPEAGAGELAADIKSLALRLSALELKGDGKLLKRSDGSIDMDVRAAVEDCPIGDVIREYKDNLSFLQKIETDAHLSLSAQAKGSYGNGQMPLVNAQIRIPRALLDYEGLGRKGQIALDGSITTDENLVMDARISQLLIDILGAKLRLKGSVEDVLGKDPFISVSGTARARVDSLTKVFVAERGISGTGTVDARISGEARLSQLDMVHIGAASIGCNLTARDLRIQDTPDQLEAFLPVLNARLSTQGNLIDNNIRKGARILALEADMDTLNLQYQDMFVRGSRIQLQAQNSADILKGSGQLTPLMGVLKAGGLQLRDEDGLGLGVRDNVETFRIAPATKERPTPRLSLSSESGGVLVRKGADFYGLRALKFNLSGARRSTPASSARRNHILDSLQRVYPGVPRDSLFRMARRNRLQAQDDFAGADIRISLGSSLRQYVRDWDVEGQLDLDGGHVRMPSFPLPTELSAVKGSFNNDELKLDNITVQAGQSDLSAQAHLTGLRRLLIGRGRSHLKLKADVQSNFIDANELMRAYAYYSTYDGEEEKEAQLPDSAATKLIVIPSNLEVDFSLESSGIKYDSLLVSWAAADVAMRDRTLQITNALAASNMGDIFFEGFYATRSKQDIKAGFDLNLVDITAEKVITLFPAVDTLMPMLSSFAGMLDCELAATSDIDTTMNLVLPSIDGIMKISGKDLSLKDSKEFTRLANTLMFKDRQKAHIDNMAVAGVVQDNILEIFPFVLNVDRYLLAASGRQSLDKDFNYHISVIKSPLLVKFGVNAWGPDFDHVHYGLAVPKYRSSQVPVYTKQLDTVQYNLIAAIHNIFELGVEKALAENRARELQLASDTDAQPELEFSRDSLEQMEARLEDLTSTATSNREALKEAILRLEREAALIKRDEQ